MSDLDKPHVDIHYQDYWVEVYLDGKLFCADHRLEGRALHSLLEAVGCQVSHGWYE